MVGPHVAFVDPSHTRCNAYWKKCLRELDQVHHWAEGHIQGVSRHGGLWSSGKPLVEVRSQETKQDTTTQCLLCVKTWWAQSIYG